MKLLDGHELTSFIKERQAKEVRRLKQSEQVQPKLSIVQLGDDQLTERHVRTIEQYATDIDVAIAISRTDEADDVVGTVTALNQDDSVQGISVQSAAESAQAVQGIYDDISPSKAVDGLTDGSSFVPPASMAINWLLGGYNIDLRSKHLLVIGHGKLIGTPVADMLRKAELHVETIDDTVNDLAEIVLRADIIIIAAEGPGLINSGILKEKAVVVDASDAKPGAVADEVYERKDLAITPQNQGIEPLAEAALLDNVLQAARDTVDHDE